MYPPVWFPGEPLRSSDQNSLTPSLQAWKTLSRILILDKIILKFNIYYNFKLED
jgi:hypothetical protein